MLIGGIGPFKNNQNIQLSAVTRNSCLKILFRNIQRRKTLVKEIKWGSKATLDVNGRKMNILRYLIGCC